MEEETKYFEVEREYIYGKVRRYCVFDDGTQAHDSYDVDDDGEEIKEITTGFVVHTYDEMGMTIGYDFYEVQTNTRTMENNEEEVLTQIRADHAPEDGWQNNDW